MRKKGFTLVEILVAIGIMSLIIGIGGISYRDYSNRQQVTSAAREIRSALRLAQTRAFSGEKPSGCNGNLLSYSFRTDNQNPIAVYLTPTPTPTATPLSPGTGLYGEYFEATNLTDLAGGFTRTDATINFNWGSSNVTQGGASVDDTFSVRWTGFITAPVSGTYTFWVRSDDGNRMWINNVQVTNDWTSHSVRDASGTANLVAGQKVPIRLEYFDSGGLASVQLAWQGPGISTRTVVAQRYLYPPTSAPTPVPTPTCSTTVRTMNHPGFSPIKTSSSPINVTYTAPTISGSRIIGLTATMTDDGGNYEVLRTVRLNNNTSTTNLSNSCPTRSTGYKDICSADNIHSYTIPSYANNPSLAITSLTLNFREYESSTKKLDFSSLVWRYVAVCASPTPVPTPTTIATPTPVPTPGPRTYIVEAVCSGTEDPIVVQTLQIPASINLSNFNTIEFKPVIGGTNIPSGDSETITVVSPVNNYTESVVVDSSGDVQ